MMNYNEIISTPLPTYSDSYTVIPHNDIITQIKAKINEKGLILSDEQYSSNKGHQIVMGKYSIENEIDKELNLMLVFGNSYNKMRKFKVVSGAEVKVCSNGMLIGDMNNYARKHTGNALIEAMENINNQIEDIDKYFKRLINHKEQLKELTISKKLQAELCGRLLMEEELITMVQLGIIQKELNKPTFDYKVSVESGWNFYNSITHSLKKSHPVSFIEDHEKIHNFFIEEFALVD